MIALTSCFVLSVMCLILGRGGLAFIVLIGGSLVYFIVGLLFDVLV